MDISTNPKPKIYRSLHENTGAALSMVMIIQNSDQSFLVISQLD